MMATRTPGAQRDGLTEAWRGFRLGIWQNEVNVRDFIQQNYTPYDDDESFLAQATKRTEGIWNRLKEMFKEERKKGGP